MIEIVFIVDFDWAIKNAHFPELCKRLPEGQTGISVGFLVLKTQVIRIMAALATSPSPIFGMTDEKFRGTLPDFWCSTFGIEIQKW